MKRSLQAALFDMDGTLVETEQHWGEAMFELARQLGGRMSQAARQRTVGTSMRVAMGILYADLGLARTEAELEADARWVEERTRQLMAAGVAWRPGARDLLVEVLAEELPTALVTTTPRRLASVVLEQITADLGADPFDVTVCGDEVSARKPDPAPYRLAMTRLGTDPQGCVVVEDSAVGVASGLAAGAAVIGVPSLQPLHPAPGLVLLDSLAGIGLPELHQVLAGRELTDAQV